jgi:hypothetical protein
MQPDPLLCGNRHIPVLSGHCESPRDGEITLSPGIVLADLHSPESHCKEGKDMRKNLTIGFLAVLSLVSCKTNIFDPGETIGDTVIELQFNLIDYLDASQTTLVYGEDPEIPGNGGVTEIYSPAKTLNIADEIGDIKSIESVNVFLDYDIDNVSGWSTIEYVVYLSAVGEDPFSVPGIYSDRISLRPDTKSKGGLTITADERLKDLFSQKQFQYAAKIVLESSDSSENIRGQAGLTSFVADVVITL